MQAFFNNYLLFSEIFYTVYYYVKQPPGNVNFQDVFAKPRLGFEPSRGFGKLPEEHKHIKRKKTLLLQLSAVKRSGASSMTKILALYLPQFHVTPENNEWWGEGFTEWTNTRKAEKLFRGHYQPRVPFADNYYDLSDSSVMRAQAALAKQYGIHGFCYYHYWFGGKQMLHKPLLQMLADSSVDIPFCLSWANDSWNRAWDGEEKEILVQQEYGEKDDWQKHLDYLVPFFNDDRYIKEGNRPVFFVYRAVGFQRMDAMFTYWDAALKTHGFDGIYIIETLNSFQLEPFTNQSKAVFHFEPMYSLRKSVSIANKIRGTLGLQPGKHFLSRDSYKRIWKNIVRFAGKLPSHNKKICFGAFVDWDNTARKGRKGLVVKGARPEIFGKYLSDLLDIAQSKNSPFLVINAWNEWAEGCYLEADEQFGYAYLEQVKAVAAKTK